jgi:hypothetical protein
MKEARDKRFNPHYPVNRRGGRGELAGCPYGSAPLAALGV